MATPALAHGAEHASAHVGAQIQSQSALADQTLQDDLPTPSQAQQGIRPVVNYWQGQQQLKSERIAHAFEKSGHELREAERFMSRDWYHQQLRQRRAHTRQG